MPVYSDQTWHDLPTTDTPVDSGRLAHMEAGILDSSQVAYGHALRHSAGAADDLGLAVFPVLNFATPQSAFNAAAAAGGIVKYPHGNFTPAAVLNIPPNLAHKVVIDLTGTTVLFTSGCQRFADFNGNTTPGDTYQNITVRGGTFDCTSIGALAAGGHHLVIGTMGSGIGGPNMYKTSIADVTVEQFKVINAPVYGAGGVQLFCVAIAGSVLSTDPQQTTKRVTIRDWDITGCDTGIYVGGFNRATNDYCNLILDDIVIERGRHILPTLTANFISNNVILGHHAIGNRGRISDVYATGCGDVAFETDTWQSMRIERCVAEDSWNACFYHNQFAPALVPSAQRLEYIDCTAKRTNYVPASFGTIGSGSQGGGWWAQPNATYGNPVPLIRLRNCSFLRTTADLQVAGSAAYFDSCRNVDIDGWFSDEPNVTTSATGPVFPYSIFIHPGIGNLTYFSLRRARFQIAGAGVTAGTTIWSAVKVMTGQAWCEFDDVIIDYNLTATGATGCRAIWLGDDSFTATVGGRFRRVRFDRCSDTSGLLFVISPTATLTIQPAVWIDSCSSRLALTANGTAETRTLVSYRPGSGAQQNYSNVYVKSSQSTGKSPLIPQSITPSGPPFAYRNIDGWRERVSVQGGTVTQILWSQDGATFYDLGVTAGWFSLDSGDYLQVSYTVAPTMVRMQDKA